jgi:hypothetical protein
MATTSKPTTAGTPGPTGKPAAKSREQNMGRFIAEFGGKYCEWSTVVDAPVTYLLSEGELREHIRQQYGEESVAELGKRLERVAQYGCSGQGYTKQDLLGYNRAGPDEAHLGTEEEIVRYFTLPGAGGADQKNEVPVALSRVLLTALEAATSPAHQALRVLLSRCVPQTLDNILCAACEYAREDRDPGESALEFFGERLDPLEDAGLAHHEVIIAKLFCRSGAEDLRFIFSNELYPRYAEACANCTH